MNPIKCSSKNRISLGSLPDEPVVTINQANASLCQPRAEPRQTAAFSHSSPCGGEQGVNALFPASLLGNNAVLCYSPLRKYVMAQLSFWISPSLFELELFFWAPWELRQGRHLLQGGHSDPGCFSLSKAGTKRNPFKDAFICAESPPWLYENVKLSLTFYFWLRISHIHTMCFGQISPFHPLQFSCILCGFSLPPSCAPSIFLPSPHWATCCCFLWMVWNHLQEYGWPLWVTFLRKCSLPSHLRQPFQGGVELHKPFPIHAVAPAPGGLVSSSFPLRVPPHR